MYFQCLTENGLNAIKLTYATDEDLMGGLTFKTGLIDQPPLSTGKSWAYNGTAVNGSTDGSIIEDFKSEKVKKIKNKSLILEGEGLAHNSETFKIDTDAISYISGVMIGVLGLEDMTGQIYPAMSGFYVFIDNDDVKSLYAGMKSRLNSIYGGQNSLIGSVSAASNTQAAMDAIIDSRV